MVHDHLRGQADEWRAPVVGAVGDPVGALEALDKRLGGRKRVDLLRDPAEFFREFGRLR